MLGQEIRKIIDNNNKKIESLVSPDFFTLNNEVADLLAENRKLQEQCAHEFDEDGVCVYCYKQQ